MKRTSFLFASLTAIALLSCSSDNLTSTAEDVNYPQTPALKNIAPIGDRQGLTLIAPIDEEQGFFDPGQSEINTNARKCVPCGSMSVTAPYPQEAWSSEAVCDFTSLPSNSVNVSYQFTSNPPSGKGSFSTDYVYVICGDWYIAGNIVNIANISTTSFAGLPANVKCYIGFHGKCNGTAVGGGPCTLTFSSIQGCQDYKY
jgi:hypothetical protein